MYEDELLLARSKQGEEKKKRDGEEGREGKHDRKELSWELTTPTLYTLFQAITTYDRDYTGAMTVPTGTIDCPTPGHLLDRLPPASPTVHALLLLVKTPPQYIRLSAASHSYQWGARMVSSQHIIHTRHVL